MSGVTASGRPILSFGGPSGPAKPAEKPAAGAPEPPKTAGTGTDNAQVSGEGTGSNPVNFGSWKDNLKRGTDDKDGIKSLQKTLNKHGAKIKEDGKFGKETREAVKKWQKENGLKADGIVGKYTRSRMEREQNKNSKDPNTTIPSGGIAEQDAAVKKQQKATKDKESGVKTGGFNKLRSTNTKQSHKLRETGIATGPRASIPGQGEKGK